MSEIVVLKMGDHESWRAEYKGHEILVVNKSRTRLEIDGVEVAVQKGRIPVATKLNLIGSIPGSDELVIVTLNGSLKNEYKGVRTEVHIFVGQELEKDYGFVDPQRKFTHVDELIQPPKEPKAKRTKGISSKLPIRRKKKNKDTEK